MSELATRIVFVISSLGGGGAERVIVDLCQYFSEIGRKVSLLTLSGEDADAYELPKDIHRVRIDIRRQASNRFGSIRFTATNILKMRRTILALQPDIVVSFIDTTNIRVILALLGTNIGIVAAERVHPAYGGIGPVWGIARRLSYRMANVVVVQTRETASWLRSAVKTKHIAVIPNAVRRADFVPPASEETPRDKLVIAIGRLTAQKGFDLLLEAFALSEIQKAGWRLAILGEGEDRANLVEKARSLAIPSSVLDMPGFVQTGPWLAKSSIFVLSSRFEGFPNALIEAMQLGNACISFDCPSGPRDLIANGNNGVLVPGEDVTQLAEALRQLAGNADLRIRLGREASRIADVLSTSHVYGLWREAIDQAYKNKGSSGKLL